MFKQRKENILRAKQKEFRALPPPNEITLNSRNL